MAFEYNTIPNLFDNYSPVELLLLDHLSPNTKNTKGLKSYNAAKKVNVNLNETDNEYKIQALVPGYEKSQIAIDYNSANNSIIIEGKLTNQTKQKENETDNKPNPKYLVKEYELSDFRREIKLPSPIIIDNISANLECGILSLIAPKQVVEKVHRINIA